MSKKTIVSNITTIDSKHDEMLERFENIENIIIPNLENEKNSLINESNNAILKNKSKIEMIGSAYCKMKK